jgi:ketosteroid isomerase-like protein
MLRIIAASAGASSIVEHLQNRYNFASSIQLGILMKTMIAGMFLVASALASPNSMAQTTTDAADVWVVVEAQWNAAESGSTKWIDESLSDDFSGWPNSAPAPRSKESVKMWERVTKDLGKSVAHELYPLSIVVNGDTAIAHYLYSSVYESKDGETEINNGRYTDVLIRTEDGWKFLAWHGGDDASDD